MIEIHTTMNVLDVSMKYWRTNMNEKDRFKRKPEIPDEEIYEPTDEEWEEIEGLLAHEHKNKMMLEIEHDKNELEIFKTWSKRNGMLW